MRWLIKGSLKWHCDNSYRIDWERKAPSKIAQIFKDFLYKNFRSNILYEEYRIPRSRLRVDFLDATKKVAYEVSGRQHTEFVKFFHENKQNFLAAWKRDVNKISFLESNGYKVIELFDEDIKNLSLALISEKIEKYDKT